MAEEKDIDSIIGTLKLIYGEDGIRKTYNSILFKDSEAKLGFLNTSTGEVIDCKFNKMIHTPKVMICGNIADGTKKNAERLHRVELYSLTDNRHFNVSDVAWEVEVITLPKTSKLLLIIDYTNVTHIFSTEKFEIIASLDKSQYNPSRDINFWGEPEFICIAYKHKNTWYGVSEDGTVGEVYDLLKAKYPDIETIKSGKTVQYKVTTADGNVEILGANGFRY